MQVITVPVHFSDQQRAATAAAGAAAGLQTLRLLHGTLRQTSSYHPLMKVRWNIMWHCHQQASTAVPCTFCCLVHTFPWQLWR